MKIFGRKNYYIDKTLFFTMISMLIAYIFMHDLFGGTLFSYNDWDSYTLQALAWKEGRLSLGENYEWLELAIYQGEYFVSFPPIPSVVMFPFALIFGMETPSNLIMCLTAIFSVYFAYKSLRLISVPEKRAAFFSVFLVCGSNMMWMSTVGGVWFLAQGFNLLFCLLSVYLALKNKRCLSYAILALAVGCRPFSAIYFIVLFLYFYYSDRKKQVPFVRWIGSQLKYLIVPILIALAYMAYNYARFDNPLEFGHNYLPEFLESEKGQFSLSYLGENLVRLLFRPVLLMDSGALTYPTFDGFVFYLANPVFLLLIVRAFLDCLNGKMNMVKWGILAAMAGNIFLLCLHKTLGGWQFGARYTVDMIPFALLYFILDGKLELKKWECFICIFGVLFNLYGTMAMHFLY